MQLVVVCRSDLTFMIMEMKSYKIYILSASATCMIILRFHKQLDNILYNHDNIVVDTMLYTCSMQQTYQLLAELPRG